MRTFEDTLTVWRVFEEFVRDGYVRSIGISNTYDLHILRQLYSMSDIKPSFLQNRFYAKSGYDVEIRRFCVDNNIKYQSFWTLTANPHVLRSDIMNSIRSKRIGVTAAQIFFKFVRSQGIIPLSGTTSVEHMTEDLAVESMESLNAEEIALLQDELFNG
jgi:diketogulonate reductase-like aldo/keto reductase